ncbi:hypothetical protein BCF46_1441 [Litoreibacter meonggei]|uniref:Uncharacterized protein n=1 Tax=Litoreibacter meonggei TaxID=1049199 RepID=A0A497X3M0_9RHOB|nr:hypothetical protein [Litoreibacter meonggei]RLJ59293.1 hypothetical protein BCF46_1441 [Litoreibacter meonggei]
MRLLRLLSVSILALSMGLFGADAQSLRRDNGPAENPPASFKGKQYVDSRGCVYIRAGFSGDVKWVPRVTRARKVICGQRPSLGTSTQTAKAAPKAAPKKVVRKAKTQRTPARTKVVKRTTKVAAPTPKTTRRVVRKAVPTPKVQTRVVRKQVNSKRGTAQPRVVYRCGASEFSSQFINNGARCGPQDGVSPTVIRKGVSPQSRNQKTQGQLVGPKEANRKIVESRLPVPKGYKKAWDDGRLNPLRGVGTTSGKAQMQLVWSNTVPRYLIDPATGKRATAKQRRVLGIF